MDQIPSDFVTYDISQKWFQSLMDDICQTDITMALNKWTTDSATKNSTFRLWSFFLKYLLEPFFELYISIRTCNFSQRNAALSRFAPIFFSTNHRNYSRLCAQHLLDLQTCSPYLFERMSRAFAVTRSKRRFLSIALDQMIECTINKHGKGKGGISGRLNEVAINNWADSFAFRALVASNLHEICGIETSDNSIDSHVECSPNRKNLDNDDLSIIVKKLRQENIFSKISDECHKIQSGLVFHDDIIANITTLYERGQEALIKYVNERLITKVVSVDFPLIGMPLLKLLKAESYVPKIPKLTKKESSASHNIQDFNSLVKLADEEIRRTLIIAQQRDIKPISELFAHEFSPVPFSLCDPQHINFFNQQTKSVLIDIFYNKYPSSFYSSSPVSRDGSAIVIDGNSLLETKPNSNVQTLREYAIQLLQSNINNLFKTHDRIDIVFESIESKSTKMFIKKYGNITDKCVYHLKGDDKLETPFSKFIQSNRAAVAACIKECWMEVQLIEYLPKDRLLVIGGPDYTAVKLQYGTLPISDYILESTQIDSNTRIILHVNAIRLDQKHKTVFIQSTDCDILLLAIAFSLSINLDHFVIESFDTLAKKITYIDVTSIANNLHHQSIDTNIVLVLHTLSGCDNTSYIRNITKEKLFQRFFDNPARYSSILELTMMPPSQTAIDTAEILLIDCYSFDSTSKSLDDLRGKMASMRVKDRSRKNIAANLPPSTMAFREHCLRCSRQLKIWLESLEPNVMPQALLSNGYEYSYVLNKIEIKWSTLCNMPNDYRLQTCGECKSGCMRCKCRRNNMLCTFFCKCDHNACSNCTKRNLVPDSSNITPTTPRATATTPRPTTAAPSATATTPLPRTIIITTIPRQTAAAPPRATTTTPLPRTIIITTTPRPKTATPKTITITTTALSASTVSTHSSNEDEELSVDSQPNKIKDDSLTNSQVVFSSTFAHSSTTSRTTQDSSTQLMFKAPLAPTSRRANRFRKSYGLAKTRSQQSPF